MFYCQAMIYNCPLRPQSEQSHFHYLAWLMNYNYIILYPSYIMDNHQKHSLGRRAFTFFLLKKIKFAVLLFLLAGGVWYGGRWIPQSYVAWEGYAMEFLFLAAGAYFLFLLIRAYLEYRYYTFMFTEEAFIVTYGYIVRKEVAALYHQIQNVNINRGPLDRLTGVSQMVIFMTGSERDSIPRGDSGFSTHNTIILPTIGKTKAKMVQKELLMRARRHVPPHPASKE